MTGNLFPARLRTSHQEKRQNTNFRRNGKLQACEPCRKGKLRCDHMMPACGRCARRNKSSQCVYHPAPLTKTSAIPSPPASSSNQSSPNLHQPDVSYDLYSHPANVVSTSFLDTGTSRRTDITQQLPPPIPSIEYASHSPVAVPTNLTSETVHPRVARASSLPAHPWAHNQSTIEELRRPVPKHHVRIDVMSFDNRAGFTNHSAILAENELSIGIHPPSAESVPISKISSSQIERGAAVLTLLKDLGSLQKYIDKWYSFAEGTVVIEPMVKIYTAGLRSAWQKILEAQRPGDLRRMSERIWENTLKPVSRLLNRHTTPRQFCMNVTGEDLRWEVVGIIVSLVSLLAQTLKDGDPVFCSHDEAPTDRAALALKMHNASEMCVNFCDEFGVLNDLYLWLLFVNSTVHCSMRTRGCYENSKKTSALATALLCCNLHQEIKVDDHTPFFIVELRKRLFICFYENDKVSATYAGRPPKLTRYYCKLQIPLDLTDAQTMSEGSSLEDAISNLDREGWNQRGVVQACTYARLSATNALIAEEILEISLGDLPESEVIRRAAEIETKTHRCWEELPDFLRLDVNDPWSSKRSPLELLFLAFIRLDYLDHHFLLQRTLSKKANSGHASSPNLALLSVCSEIFQFVVIMVDNKDYFRDFQVDFVNILSMHGIPTAAVLAVELLHQEQNPNAASTLAYPLHRSDTIQNLSVFVSCLGTIRPEANGFQSCDRGRKFLKKILDMVLGPGPAAKRSEARSGSLESSVDLTLGAPLAQPGSDVDFMRWLDSMDWDHDSWMNFN